MKRGVSFVIAACAACMVICFAVVVVSLTSAVRRNCNDCEFAMAVGNEDVAAVARLLRRGASPNTDIFRFASDADCSGQTWTHIFDYPGPIRCTALVYTLRPIKAHRDLGNTQIARLLLEAGAAPNTADEEGNSPLIVAAWYGNAEAVRLLLARGANRNAANSQGFTALGAARRNGHQEIIALLSAAGSEGAMPLPSNKKVR